MTYEEFLIEGQSVKALDPTLWKQMRQLFVEHGTLVQIVAAILQARADLQERLANSQIIEDRDVRMAIGIQGQVLGINNILALIYELMQEPTPEADDE